MLKTRESGSKIVYRKDVCLKIIDHDQINKVILFFLLIPIIGIVALSAVCHAAPLKGNLIFIMDGSGSMEASLEKESKISVAKEVMTSIVNSLNSKLEVGLVAYGHRRRGDCKDVEELVAVGPLKRELLIEKITSIRPTGMTPISLSLKMTAEKIKSFNERTTVILISDGQETCMGDPCELVRDLKSEGNRFKLHVIGFGVTEDVSRQLGCVAKSGGGKYFSAENAEQFENALKYLVGAGPLPHVKLSEKLSALRPDKDKLKKNESKKDKSQKDTFQKGKLKKNKDIKDKAPRNKPDMVKKDEKNKDRVKHKKKTKGEFKKPAFLKKGTIVLNVNKGRVRNEPSLSSQILFNLSKGDQARVLEQKQDWYRIKTPDNRTGWAYYKLFDGDPGIIIRPSDISSETIKMVTNFKIQPGFRGAEKVVFFMNQFQIPKTFFVAKDSSKVVCDFSDTVLGAGIKPVSKGSGKIIERIRTGLHANPPKSRFVLDLVSGRQYELEHMFFKNEKRYELVVKPLR